MAKKGAFKRKFSGKIYGGAIFFQISEKGAIFKISLGNPDLDSSLNVQITTNVKITDVYNN